MVVYVWSVSLKPPKGESQVAEWRHPVLTFSIRTGVADILLCVQVSDHRETQAGQGIGRDLCLSFELMLGSALSFHEGC